MMKYILIIIILSSIFACNQARNEKNNKSETIESKSISLSGTIWECKIVEECANTYEFKEDSSFKFYSCEMEDTLYGTYSFIGDTLILDEKGSVYDMSDDEQYIKRKKYYAEIKNGKLNHIKLYDWYNGKFELSNFKFDDNYYYTKKK